MNIAIFGVCFGSGMEKQKNEPFDRTKLGVDELNKSRIVIFEVAGSEFLF